MSDTKEKIETSASDRPPYVTEIVWKGPCCESVHYRRPFGSMEAARLMKEVNELNEDSAYFYRHVTRLGKT